MKKGEKYILQKSFEGAGMNDYNGTRIIYEIGEEFEITLMDTENIYLKSSKEDVNYNIDRHLFHLYFKAPAKHIEISL